MATISWTFRILALVTPLVLGYFTYRLMKALHLSGEERLGALPLRAVLRLRRDRGGADTEPGPGETSTHPVELVADDGANLQVYEEPDGRWRWTYRHPADGVELNSNKTYTTADAPQQAATRAYPDLSINPPSA